MKFGAIPGLSSEEVRDRAGLPALGVANRDTLFAFACARSIWFEVWGLKLGV